ncbi:MAG: hypothetical protein Q4E59_00535 [Bacteroidales bacterium]|nr:hypothetical protein [Bacteroidales bacterium]
MERQIAPVAHQSNAPVGINFFDPSTLETLNRFSTMFANSSLVPENYRIGGVVGGKTGEGPKKTVSEAEAVANCVIAFDVATRIVASPLMVMQNLYIVYGRPSWSSKFLIATINTCGRFEPLKFEMTSNGVCSNGVANVKCVAWTTPKGVTHDENGKPITSKSPQALRGTAVTIQMAVEEGWYTKNGSKWRTMPEQMLRYRAASFWCSTYAPELSMGMRTVEENIEDADYIDVTTQVEEEIAAQANKSVVGFDNDEEAPAPPAPRNVPAGVGEIQEQETTSPVNQASAEDEEPGY